LCINARATGATVRIILNPGSSTRASAVNIVPRVEASTKGAASSSGRIRCARSASDLMYLLHARKSYALNSVVVTLVR